MSVVLQTEVRRHRLTVDDFHRMGEAGIRAAKALAIAVRTVRLDSPPPHVVRLSSGPRSVSERVLSTSSLESQPRRA